MQSIFEPFRGLKRVIDAFGEGVARVLGDQLVGIYLQGSLATGDFDAFSDVDWIVVVEGDLSAETVQALQAFHAQLYDHDSDWARHLEGSYFPRDLLADPLRCGEALWFLDHGSRQLVRSAHCNTIVVRWVLSHQAMALVGPPASELMPPISAEMLRADVAQTIVEWGRDILADPAPFNNQFYQAFILQSYCRMRHTLAVGRVGSKRAGTEWAKRTLDPGWHALIDQSWATRGNAFETSARPADPDAFAATLDFVAEAIDAVVARYLVDAAVGSALAD